MEAMASKGQRVLAGATASTPDALPKDHTGFDFQFSGLVGLVATMLGLVIGLPDLGTLTGFVSPPAVWLGVPIMAGIAVLGLLELAKSIFATRITIKTAKT